MQFFLATLLAFEGHWWFKERCTELERNGRKGSVVVEPTER